jgi:hypothetical protein
LEEILLVEEHCRADLDYRLSEKRDKDGDMWGYLDCDVADALGGCLPDGSAVSHKYGYEVSRYKEQTQSSGTDYFDFMARETEHRLRDVLQDDRLCRQNELRLGRFLPTLAYRTPQELTSMENKSVPKIRYVAVKTKKQASSSLEKRARYWRNLKEEQQKEIEQNAIKASEEISRIEEHDVRDEADFSA